MRARATDVERAERLVEVAELVAAGRKPAEIERFLTKKWACGERQVRRYLREHAAAQASGSSPAAAPRAADGAAVERYRTIGAPPDDPLELQLWFARSLALSTQSAMLDTEISERQRRDEIRKSASIYPSLVPYATVHKAKKIVQRHASDIEEVTQGATEQLRQEDPEDAGNERTRSLRANPGGGRRRRRAVPRSEG